MTEPDTTAAPAAYTLHRRAGEPAPPPSERRAGLLRHDAARIIEGRHFGLVFQPIVRLTDRRPAYHEALLRLQPPDGMVKLPTSVFVQVVAEWGLQPVLDAAVLDAALTAWSHAGSTPVSVNIAGRCICDPAFIAAAVARIGGEGAALLVEVNASAAIGDFAALKAGVDALREAGARVVLDDLGADPSALDCVRAARFDQMKIDGATVRNAGQNERGRRLLAALVQLANAAGAETVAKQIETLPQAWLMAELGVKYGQGWLFGAPGPLPGSE